MKHAKCYLPEYPRPQFVRQPFLSLNGSWSFAFDDADVGERAHWYDSPSFDKTINVPFSYHCDASGVGDSSCHNVVWYSRTVDFSPLAAADKRLILHFEGSDYETKVWIDGAFVGAHTGGYDRFSFDITEYCSGKKQCLLTVRVCDPCDTTSVRGKQRWEKESFACFYVETTGIWKSVWCEAVAQAALTCVKITPDVDRDKATFDYSFSAVKKDMTVRTVISYGDTVIADTVTAVTRKDFSLDFSMTSEAFFFKVFLWTYYDPKIYDVEFTVMVGGVAVDTVGSYFGMRKVQCAKNVFSVNDRPEYLKMVLDQGYWEESHLTPPSEEAIKKDVELIKAVGFNGVRKHQKIEDERFLYYCDILGLYAWLEMPSMYEFTDASAEQFTREWARIVRQYQNHPSIVCFVPFNESWGIFRVAGDLRRQEFTKAIVALTKTLDGTRPVISNDGWEHTDSDIVTLHNYAETGELLKRVYDPLDGVLTDTTASTALIPKRTFCAGYAYRGQPVMMSEYGGIAYEHDRADGWGYGKLVSSQAEYIERLTGLTDAILSIDGFSGYCVTQLTDTQQEKNGLFDIRRNSKVGDISPYLKIFGKTK